MDQFTRIWSGLVPQSEQGLRQRPPLPYSAQEWDSTSRSATRVAAWLLGRTLAPAEQKLGAQAVHFAVGGLGGALYAVVFDRQRRSPLPSGLAFGIGLWLLGEEIAMPILGINGPPRHYSFADHANSLGEHMAYGMVMAVVSRWLLKHF